MEIEDEIRFCEGAKVAGPSEQTERRKRAAECLPGKQTHFVYDWIIDQQRGPFWVDEPADAGFGPVRAEGGDGGQRVNDISE